MSSSTKERISDWLLGRVKGLSNRQMMVLLAVIVGALAGMGTYLFEMLLYGIRSALVTWFPVDRAHFLYLIYPAAGIVLATLFVKYIVKDEISEGVTRVLYAMSRRDSRIAPHNCWTSIVGGATTIGFGGSVGPEAPITGVVFVLEILMLDITASSIIPLLVSSVSATTVALVFRGFDPILSITLSSSDVFVIHQIPLYVLLGVCCGLMSYYFTSMNSKVGAFVKGVQSQYRRWALGGVVLGVLIFIFPPLYGEGYEALTALMHGNVPDLFDNSLFFRFRHVEWVALIYVTAVMFFKVIAMATTNAAGGVGGTFAPSLFVGAFMGAIVALACNTLLDWNISVVSFTLVGMAGVMAGVMKAPLTSIFLIAELSNGYGLFIPLMIVASISFAVDYTLDRDSIYTKQLRQRGELLSHDKDSSVFVFLRLEDLMETDFVRIKENFTLGDLVGIISSAHRNIFPVIDNFGHLLGVVQLDDLREDMFKREMWGRPVIDYMRQPPYKILEHEQVQSILPRFEENHTWMLPVVDRDNRYLGFISKSRILNAYREALVRISQTENDD